MKFIHISDLHIGKTVNGFSMLEEQRHIFGQINGYIATERAEAVVIAGDVYDRPMPGADAVRLFDDFLTDLAGAGVAVILVSGNHDSPERISYASRLLADKNIYFYGAYDGAARQVVLYDGYGAVNFWLLPFIKPAYARGTDEDGTPGDYSGAVSAALETAGIDYGSRNVLVSHQFYTRAGLDLTRSESELSPVGGLDAVDAAIIGRFDYAALGHLHGGQSVGAGHIRYCGSPLKYSFSEWRQEKSATLVDMGAKHDLEITALPLAPLRDMRETRGTLAGLIDAGSGGARGGAASTPSIADAALAARGGAGNGDYLRVVLTDEEEIADPMNKLRSVYPNIMSLDFDNSRTRIDASAVAAAPEDIGRLSLYELFGEFFLDTQGSVMSAEQAEVVRVLLEGAGAE